MGVGVPYLEDEVAILEKMGLLVRKGKAYQSNMVLYDEQWRKAVYDKAVELLYPKLEKVKQLVDKGLEYLAETDYCYEAADRIMCSASDLLVIFGTRSANRSMVSYAGMQDVPVFSLKWENLLIP